MKLRNLTYVIVTIIAFSSCTSLQAARVDGPLSNGMYKINTYGNQFNPGDKISLVKERYREYGKAHDHANTVILNKTKAGNGIVLKVLDNESVAATFEPDAKPIKGMKVEKL